MAHAKPPDQCDTGCTSFDKRPHQTIDLFRAGSRDSSSHWIALVRMAHHKRCKSLRNRSRGAVHPGDHLERIVVKMPENLSCQLARFGAAIERANGQFYRTQSKISATPFV